MITPIETVSPTSYQEDIEDAYRYRREAADPTLEPYVSRAKLNTANYLVDIAVEKMNTQKAAERKIGAEALRNQ